jgi:hypothetical protein
MKIINHYIGKYFFVILLLSMLSSCCILPNIICRQLPHKYLTIKGKEKYQVIENDSININIQPSIEKTSFQNDTLLFSIDIKFRIKNNTNQKLLLTLKNSEFYIRDKNHRYKHYGILTSNFSFNVKPFEKRFNDSTQINFKIFHRKFNLFRYHELYINIGTIQIKEKKIKAKPAVFLFKEI